MPVLFVVYRKIHIHDVINVLYYTINRCLSVHDQIKLLFIGVVANGIYGS